MRKSKMWLLKSIFCCLATMKFVIAEEVGDSCTINGKNGLCVLIYDCADAVSLIQQIGSHDLPRCGFEGDTEIVCCPIANNPALIRRKLTQGGIKNTPRIADRECKVIVDKFNAPTSEKVIGGEVAELREFPHMGALGYGDPDIHIDFRCGGSLISDRYVLTAAHCIVTIESLKLSIVRLGVVDISGNRWNETTDYIVEQHILHPEYERPLQYHDVALIKLAKHVQFSVNVFPICLYTKETDPTIPLTVSGWGITNMTRYSTSSLLIKATLNVVPQTLCNLKYIVTRRLPKGIINHQICAGDLSGIKDTCQGDSGGPLQGATEPDGHYRLVGITSFGKSCGVGIPGVYTRVAKYLDWIEGIVWPSN